MKNSGFTLIELLVAIAVAGILAAIAVPGWLSFVQQRRLSVAADQMYRAVKATQAEAKKTKATQTLQPATEIDSSVSVTYPTPTLSFDHRGAVKAGAVPYHINLTVENGGSSSRCIVVKTLLGATTTGRNTQECNQLEIAQ
ncbi:Tfp pilus assembly protein FimT/FimU [Chroococcidiopsis sp. TS-821]|uniref:pilus assembly FimT family protein n=1 Tax=Chroococcidiopsis sp. TS-821 TaxID=1378066 RepID=UPI000CEEBA03|nr:prepilin-type N-terminal cleavage/methylation domain-containing protein [Chroococcidiopsis sp. TS-821]PPS41923.1 hypothetical protein B1A85_15695 [Chroococcidiopsis sp. TS-821]